MLSFLPYSVREPQLRLAFFAPGNPIPDYWQTGWWLWGGLAQSRAAEGAESAAFLGAGTAPILVVQGDDDRVAPPADACTRAVYLGTDGIVITGRSMDWAEDMRSNVWAFPRGMKRDGAAGGKIYSGSTASKFEPAEPFAFLPASAK